MIVNNNMWTRYRCTHFLIFVFSESNEQQYRSSQTAYKQKDGFVFCIFIVFRFVICVLNVSRYEHFVVFTQAWPQPSRACDRRH